MQDSPDLKEKIAQRREKLLIAPLSLEDEPRAIPSAGIEETLEAGLGVLKAQIQILKDHAEKKALSPSQSTQLMKYIGMLASLRPTTPKSPAANKRKEVPIDPEAEKDLKSELEGLSRKEVLKLLMPYLEDIGIDVDNVRFRKDPKEKPNDGNTREQTETTSD